MGNTMEPLVFAYGLKAECYSPENVNQGSTSISHMPYRKLAELTFPLCFYPNLMRLHVGHSQPENEPIPGGPGYFAESKTDDSRKHENRARPRFRQWLQHCTRLGSQGVNSGVGNDYESQLSIFMHHSYRNHLNRAHKNPTS